MKRIGIAVAESEHEVITVRPALTAIGTLAKDAAQVAQAAKTEEVDAIVVGLPLEETGEEGRMSRVCRTFASHLEAAGLKVFLQDERFTSVEAEQNLNKLDLKGSTKRQARDSEAAAQILERYIRGA